MGPSEECSLKMVFFPFLAQGHILPMLDMAKLFASRGVESTIVTTPANARLVQRSIRHLPNPVHLALIPLPSTDFGLPDGCENLSSLPPPFDSSRDSFYAACNALRDPFTALLRKTQPHCVVSDQFLPWTCDAAAELGIPRLVFHGISLFALSVYDSLSRHKPLDSSPPDEESLLVPGIPHTIRLLKSQISTFTADTELLKIAGMQRTVHDNYGVVVNSFHELEPDYVAYHNNAVGMKSWLVGPLGRLCNDINDDDKPPPRGADDRDSWPLKWLDGRSPGSVVYACFGSIAEFSVAQLRELALGLEHSSHPFVWVVRGGDDCWIPEGFEERTEDKGLLVRGWAPQVPILNHPAVGGFVTHCGWNSSLEGISAGLPLVTWPVFADQFYNERLIMDVLKIGVAVGVKKNAMSPEKRELVEAKEIAKAVKKVMDDGEEAEERRERARKFGEAAKRAMEREGSSYNDVSNLIQELMDRNAAKKRS